jgi:dTMP kinase
MRGKFITLEGVDGAGKTTFLPWIEQRLRAKGVDVVATREPGGTRLGEKLRQLLLSEPMFARTEALLMFAAREQHVAEVIEPALAAGRWVLCDRFTDATFAYQGAGRGVADAELEVLERWVQRGLQPDLTVLFDLPVEIARARSSASRAPDRFESERSEFLARVREGYLRRAQRDAQRFCIVDGSLVPDAVKAQLADIELLR